MALRESQKVAKIKQCGFWQICMDFHMNNVASFASELQGDFKNVSIWNSPGKDKLTPIQ